MNKKQIILILLILSLVLGTLNTATALVSFDIPVVKGYDQRFTGSASNIVVNSYMSESPGNDFLNVVVSAYRNIENIVITLQSPFKSGPPIQYTLSGNGLKTNGNGVPNKIDHRDNGYYLNLNFELSSIIKNFNLTDYRISKIDIDYSKQPDLVIRDIVKNGNYYNVVIRNVGDAPAGSSYLGALHGKTTVNEFRVGSLDAGEGTVIKTKVNLKYTSFKVDNRKQVNELFRTNNERMIEKMSDFRISKVVKKSPNTYQVTIKNGGDKDSGVSYLGTYVKDKLVKKTKVPSLKASKTKTVKVTLNSKHKKNLKTFTANYNNKIQEPDNSRNSKTVR